MHLHVTQAKLHSTQDVLLDSGSLSLGYEGKNQVP